MADTLLPQPNSEVSSPTPLAFVVAVGAGAYILGRYTRRVGEEALPSLLALGMTYVVFRGLDMLWPFGMKAVHRTPIPAVVNGIAQGFQKPLGYVPASQAIVDAEKYMVK